jgi:hypothetical protein
MTAKEMVLAYYGYGKDYDPNNLSSDLREQLIATINLMHEWEELQMLGLKYFLKLRSKTRRSRV